MRIIIETIPFAQIPNAQCGDWRRDERGDLIIRVAEEIGNDSALLVALHELVEVALCEKRGISCAAVDLFDAKFEAARQPDDDSEAGDAPDSPYRREHFFATTIERLMCAELGVDWFDHDEKIMSLT